MAATVNRRTLIAVITIIIFASALASRTLVFKVEWYAHTIGELPRALQWAEQSVRWLILCLIGVYVACRIAPWRAFREFGLAARPGKGVLVGFVATLPMLVPFMFIAQVRADADLLFLVFTSTIWPLGEEILFRGYTFRQLHRRAGWNLWVAAAATALLFGLVHLSQTAVQNQPVAGQLGTVAMMSALSMLSCWVFTRWEDNLWLLVSLHGFMNLWWAVFDMAENPLGGWFPNLMRLASVLLIVVLTLRHGRAESLSGAASEQAELENTVNIGDAAD
jgi:membrane protease YdiL (CAAX protease family)